jgi:diguanylate cyclase (GGDEF)-like protein
MYRCVYENDILEQAMAPDAPMLLERYHKAAREGDLPDWTPFLPDNNLHIRDNMIVIHPLKDGDYFYDFYGAAIVEAAGHDLTNSRLSTVRTELAAFLRDAYDRALATRKPCLTVHRAASSHEVYLWERLILPVRDDKGRDALILLSYPRELRKDLLSATIEASPVGIMAFRFERDEQGTALNAFIVMANSEAASITRHSVDTLMDGRLLNLFPGIVPMGVWDRYVRIADQQQPEEFEIYYDHDDCNTWLRVNAVPFGDGVLVSFSDISALKAAYFEAEKRRFDLENLNKALAAEIARREALEQELRLLATTDALTGTANRRAFSEKLQNAVFSAKRYNHPVAVIAVDIDHFKGINDAYGHACGDQVLIRVAQLLNDEIRHAIDLVGRVGGEEFMILLPYTALEGALTLAQRLQIRLAGDVMQVQHHHISTTASFGVAALLDNESHEQLLNRADEALYAAKHAGRNRVLAAHTKNDPFADLTGDNFNFRRKLPS